MPSMATRVVRLEHESLIYWLAFVIHVLPTPILLLPQWSHRGTWDDLGFPALHAHRPARGPSQVRHDLLRFSLLMVSHGLATWIKEKLTWLVISLTLKVL